MWNLWLKYDSWQTESLILVRSVEETASIYAVNLSKDSRSKLGSTSYQFEEATGSVNNIR